tara:strand:+ start:168 stop:371 length:204 start_codon:yes stop_codon:yes gene_type:complete
MITYILIGVIFMFLLEHFTSLDKFKKYIKTHPNAFKKFGFKERVLGILLWPLWLGVFSYSFFIELFK